MFLANAYLGKEETDSAIKVYKKLMTAAPESPISYQELALIYIDKLSDYQNALRYAEEAAQKFPKDAKSQDVLGWVYYSNEKDAKAFTGFQEAVRLSPNTPQYHYHLGLALQKTGNKAKAKDTFEQTLKLLNQNTSKEFAEEIKNKIDQCE